jgi:hypothetical protein
LAARSIEDQKLPVNKKEFRKKKEKEKMCLRDLGHGNKTLNVFIIFKITQGKRNNS